MAKPAITKRGTKAAALTYAELDTNFQNLADATVSLTAGSGGTKVTTDLNGNITLVAGTGITLSGDNTAKTLTINSSSAQNTFSTIAVAGQSNVVADSTSDTLTLIAGTNVTLATNATNDSVTINASVPTLPNTFSTIAVSGQSNVVADSTSDTLTLIAGSNLTITTNATNDSVTISAPNVATYSGIIPTLSGTSSGIQLYVTGGSSDGILRLGNTSNANSIFQATGSGNMQLIVQGQNIIFLTGITQLKETTTTQRNSITAANGMIIYNSTTGTFQGRAAGVWVDLH